MNWTVQYAEYYLYRGVSRTNAYEFMQQSGAHVPKTRNGVGMRAGDAGGGRNQSRDCRDQRLF